MKYEHQINWANACDTNLDVSINWLVQNGLIYLLSTPTLNLLEQMANLEAHTSY